MNILRSRGLVALVAAVSLVVPAWGSAAAAATLRIPSGFEVSARRTVAAGVEHVVMVRRDPPLVMNLARISPSAAVDLQVVSAFDKVGPGPSAEALEHPTAMCARVDCLVGVNGDFYIPRTKEPYGGVASAGRLLRSPAADRSQAWMTPSGQLALGNLGWSGSVTPAQGAALSLAGVNVDLPSSGGIVLYTPDYGPSTKASATEVLVRLDGTPRRGQSVRAELLRMDDGHTGIPADGAILAGTGAGATALRDLWNHRHQAGPIRLRVDVDAVQSVGVFPVLVRGGQSVAPDLGIDLFTGKHARSLIGTTGDGTLLLANVDDKRDDSRGATVRDAAEILVGLGVVEGGNLDGGGGSTFVVEGQVANRPTDGPGSPASEPDGPFVPHQYAPGYFERPAVNLVAIVAREGDSNSGGSGSSRPQPDGSPNGSGGSGGGGSLFGLVDSARTGGTGSGGTGGSVNAASLTAPSALSSTPLASASTLYKVLTLVKARSDQAKARAQGGGEVADPGAAAGGQGRVEDPTTTTSTRGRRVSAEGEQAAAPIDGRGSEGRSRQPFVVTAVLLILTIAGTLGMLFHARQRMLAVAGLVSAAPVVPPRRRTEPPANWW